jgi:hypothetical protein
MRLVLCLAVVGLLIAVVLGALPLAWGFVALAVEVFICFVAVYDLIPRPVYREDEDE